MNKEKYLQQRNTLLEEAQNLINSGDFKEFNAKKIEIEELDNQFEESALQQANLNALKDNSKVKTLNNKGVVVQGNVVENTNNNIIADDIYNTIEYRKAFMNYVVKGEAIPSEFNNIAGPTKTSDIGSVIPTEVMEKIIEKVEATGMIISLVTRTAYKGGVSIPTSTVKPVASWVAEGATSEKQKKTTGTITFAYHKLRCAVSVTLESEVTSLAVFEATLIQNVTQAMVIAIEKAIISGTGSGQPKGIITETTEEGQTLEISTLSYDTLIDAESALPFEYESNAAYCMTKKTFMEFQKIKDLNGQPIARINYGLAGKPERSLLGRPVVICNYLDSFSSELASSKIFAFIFNFSDYILNTNFNMGIKTYEDNETDDIIHKSVMLVDGKVVDKSSLVLLKKTE